jgi:hypothetical protein
MKRRPADDSEKDTLMNLLPSTRWFVTLIGAAMIAAAPAVQAQRLTEMFVPIGQSAGLSGKFTLLARVQAVNATERSVTLNQDATTLTVKLGANAPIWIDRSKQQQTNSAGTLADVRPGLLAEVKFVKNNRAAGEAEWIKVQSAP